MDLYNRLVDYLEDFPTGEKVLLSGIMKKLASKVGS